MGHSSSASHGNDASDQVVQESASQGLRLSDEKIQTDSVPNPEATLASVVQKTARLLGCEKLLVLLSDPLENTFALLASSHNNSPEDQTLVRQPEVTSLLSQILHDRVVSSEELPLFKNVSFTQPLIYNVQDPQGNITEQIPVGVMIGFRQTPPNETDEAHILKLFAGQISQLIAVADFLPKIRNTVTNYQTAVSSFPIGVTFLDQEGKIFEVNALMKLLKIDESAKGTHYREALKNQGAFLIPLIEKALMNGEASDRELPLTEETGTRTLKIQIQPTFQHATGAPQIAGASIAVFDVTQKKTDESLTSSVIATISHDLRTPLTIIAGNAETIKMFLEQDGSIDGELGLEFIEGIIFNTGRMGRMVADLLDAERISAGMPLSLAKADYDLVQSLNNIAKAQQSFSQNCRIEVICPYDELTVIADKDRIEQVTANYLNNAVKYSPQGGTVTVKIDPEDTMVKVSVIDQGIGIPPEQLQKLFGRLFRVESDKHEGIKGTGLGLFLCKNLIELHGGAVNVESVYGEGSTFSFKIPLK